MYSQIFQKFNSKLTDRKLDVQINIITSIFSIIIITSIIMLSIFTKSWIAILLCDLSLLICLFLAIYIAVFESVNKKIKINAKDFFNMKKIFNLLGTAQPKDTEILIEILKETEINTRPKVQEAIRYFQNILIRKTHKGIDFLPILSIAISIMGIATSSLVVASTKDWLFFFIVFTVFVILSLCICIFAKMIYKTAYYSTSEYAVYERIEIALSEIWMKQLIK